MRADETATWTAVQDDSRAPQQHAALPPQHPFLPPASRREQQALGGGGGGGAGGGDFLFHRLSSAESSGVGGGSVASVPPEDEELMPPPSEAEAAGGHESYDGGSFEPDIDEAGEAAGVDGKGPSAPPVRLAAPAPPAGLREDDLSLTARINAHLLAAASRSAAELLGGGATSAALQRALAAHVALQSAEDEAWGGPAEDDRSVEYED